MKINLRNLLFFFCLIITFQTPLYAIEKTSQNSELLENKMVQIQVSNANAYSVSVLRAFRNLTEFIQNRYYSLLNWNVYSRTDLEVEKYNRQLQFGRWVNDPNSETCLNTRAKVLVRDSTKPALFKETQKCLVDQGAWKDPYTNKVFNSANAVQIDHLVPLKNAYISGAHKWNFQARCLYANYLGYAFHLLPVSAIENMKKSDKAPDQYMPPNKFYACTYVRQWLSVKMLWGLSMTLSEANAIRRVITENNCSNSSFRVTDAELDRQRKFAQANMNLCENTDSIRN